MKVTGTLVDFNLDSEESGVYYFAVIELTQESYMELWEKHIQGSMLLFSLWKADGKYYVKFVMYNSSNGRMFIPPKIYNEDMTSLLPSNLDKGDTVTLVFKVELYDNLPYYRGFTALMKRG